jgi:hypothetical protein
MFLTINVAFFVFKATKFRKRNFLTPGIFVYFILYLTFDCLVKNPAGYQSGYKESGLHRIFARIFGIRPAPDIR